MSLSTFIQKTAFSLTLVLFFSIVCKGQSPNLNPDENKLDIKAQFRPRLEFRNGAFRPLSKNEKPAALISERIRLTADYTYDDRLSIRLSPQNIGVWGQANMVQGVENRGNRFALFEAWTKLNLSSSWSLKMGRQVISLDDERIFGELDWAQGGRAHDALSFHMGKSNLTMKGFFAFNQNYGANYENNINNPSGNYYNTNDAFPYKWMQTLWAGFSLHPNFKITLLATNLGLQNYAVDSGSSDTTIHYTQISGANFFHDGPRFNSQFSGYYQSGKDRQGLKMKAFLLSASLGYKVNSNWQIGIGSDFLSGNDTDKSLKENRAFNPYFHTGHKFYGAMDYYHVGYSHGNVGLSDNYLNIHYKHGKGYSIGLAFHQFFTPNKVGKENHGYPKNMGQEADLSFGYTINKYANLVGGYSFYLNNPTVNFLKNTPEGKNYQQWAWLSLNITPTLFQAKW